MLSSVFLSQSSRLVLPRRVFPHINTWQSLPALSRPMFFPARLSMSLTVVRMLVTSSPSRSSCSFQLVPLVSLKP